MRRFGVSDPECDYSFVDLLFLGFDGGFETALLATVQDN
jgi:hypothetical protein